MARKFDGPLSAEDLAYLRARFPEPYVQRLVTLHGAEDSYVEDSRREEARRATEHEEEQARLAAEAAAAAAADEGEGSSGDADEDLIGDADDGGVEFDILGSTEPEVREWAANASDEEKAAALATEQAREDREPRKGVVGLLS